MFYCICRSDVCSHCLYEPVFIMFMVFQKKFWSVAFNIYIDIFTPRQFQFLDIAANNLSARLLLDRSDIFVSHVPTRLSWALGMYSYTYKYKFATTVLWALCTFYTICFGHPYESNTCWNIPTGQTEDMAKLCTSTLEVQHSTNGEFHDHQGGSSKFNTQQLHINYTNQYLSRTRNLPVMDIDTLFKVCILSIPFTPAYNSIFRCRNSLLERTKDGCLIIRLRTCSRKWKWMLCHQRPPSQPPLQTPI